MTCGRDDNLNEKLAALWLEREVEKFIVEEAVMLDEWRLAWHQGGEKPAP